MVTNTRCHISLRCFAASCYLAIASCFGASQLAATETAQKPGPRPEVIEATDKSAVEAAMPHDVIVAGTVREIKDNDGVATINFSGTEKSQFYVVVLKRNRDAVEKVHGEGLKSLNGKQIQVTGKIVEYRNRPEIMISRPEQIVVSGETKQAAAGSSQSSTPRVAVIDAADKSAIEAAVPHEVVVTGVVSNVKDNEGVATIDFSGSEKSHFCAVVLKRNREAVEKVHGDGLKSLEGKRIRVTGKIVEYRTKPQIVVSLPEQVVVLKDQVRK